MTDEQIALSNCMPVGTYDFEVVGAEDKPSKKGNPMTVVVLKVFVGDKQRTIKDYLLEVFPKKLKHFAYGIGMSAAYDSGYLEPTELIGKCGKVVIGIEDQPGYGPKNVVEDYVVAGKEPPKPKSKPAVLTTSGNDEPPF